MKRSASTALGFVVVASVVCPASAAEPRRAVTELHFDARVDVPLTLSFTALYALSEFAFKPALAPAKPRWDARDTSSADTLNALDAAAYELRWNSPRTAAKISDAGLAASAITAVGTNVIAAANDGANGSEIGENIVMIVEATAVAMLLNQAVKFIARRQRPCAHYVVLGAEAPCGKDRNDENLSFFSGHATFTSALFVSSATIATRRGYALTPLVWTSGAAITMSVSYLRVAATKHYLTDVLAGMLVGSAAGFFVSYVFHGPRDSQSYHGVREPMASASSLGRLSPPHVSLGGPSFSVAFSF